MMTENDFFKEIIREIVDGIITNKKQLEKRKAALSHKYGLEKIPSNADILEKIPDKQRFVDLLKKKPSRTLSGVTVVAIMTKPSPCPHGKCVYCPGGVDVNTPQSYTGHEPAAMRGAQYSYASFRQTTERIRQLEAIGHPTDKIELIIMGGTFTAQPIEYQKEFVKGAFDALNEKKASSLEQAIKWNEKARHRCVGLTVETRPDWCFEKQINTILDYGTTRVELGVQHPDDGIYEKIKRGHTVEDVAKSTQLLKDSFFKINYHLMPGLPGSSFEKDLEMFKTIFEDDKFKPDMLKIYPCLLIKPEYGKTELYEMWEKGEWKPYSDEEAAELIAEATKLFPKWVRVMRIQRDIPAKLILAGVKHGNLRQMIDEKLKEKKINCNCIRCREIRDEQVTEPVLRTERYTASGGEEYFISLEDKEKDKLIGFVRLRKPYKPFRKEIGENTVGIRELHVYGPSLRIGEKPEEEAQHKGFGRMLVKEAERIALEEIDAREMLIISGVGVREYYRSIGYDLKGVYMAKALK